MHSVDCISSLSMLLLLYSRRDRPHYPSCLSVTPSFRVRAPNSNRRGCIGQPKLVELSPGRSNRCAIFLLKGQGHAMSKTSRNDAYAYISRQCLRPSRAAPGLLPSIPYGLCNVENEKARKNQNLCERSPCRAVVTGLPFSCQKFKDQADGRIICRHWADVCF